MRVGAVERRTMIDVRWWMAIALAAALTLMGCGAEGGREDYVGDGDTGAAAPATVQVPVPPSEADSTTGISERTGRRGVAGDTMSSQTRVKARVRPPGRDTTSPR
jgi:hypothetical protein